MIIQSSSMGMNSQRRYSSSQKNVSLLNVWNNNKGANVSLMGNDAKAVLGDKPAETGYMNVANDLLKGLETAEENDPKEKLRKDLDKANQDIWDAFNVSKPSWESKQDIQSAVSKIRQQTLNYLLYILFGRKPEGYKQYEDECTDKGEGSGMTTESADAQPQVPDEEAIGGNYYNYFEYRESEYTSFETTGTVVTSDGTEINFNVSLSMSRSFAMASSTMVNFGAAKCCDPLVINLDCSAAEVTNQKFYFDLDADGHEEYISQLGAGSGYLALDKNGDGIINDGTELFGTASGNGFADLAQYDSDGNGWIDEADEIFDKLVIWQVDENGESSLCGLSKAGVGAIYLGATDTEFSLKDSGNTTDAIIRQTGIFLYENGNVGTVQQVDLAT